ncbi:MAG: TRAP transporter large permease subunit [Acidobacteriota bacterium]
MSEPPEDSKTARAPALLVGLHWTEDGAVALALTAMVLIPLAEVVLRALFGIGLSGAASVVQHLTLVVGMLGGALAAREGRLLSLATDTFLPEGRVKAAARVFSGAAASAVSAYLCVASLLFVRTEMEGGKVLVYGIPYWVVELVLPLGFALVALRLLWHAGEGWRGRLAALLLAAALAGLCAWAPISPEELRWPALGLLLLATVLGAPIFATLGGAALILFWGAGVPIAAVSVEHYRLVTNPTLPAIPLFTLAGYFLAEGGASRRLVKVFDALFGRVRGGPAIVTALVCAFFTTFTGASGVTILALGGLLLPVLIGARYSEKASLGLLTGAGSLGLLFPPCLPLILYAIVAQVSVEKVFWGGILPGILMVIITAWWGVSQAPKGSSSAGRFDAREAWRACWEAKWELLLPVVALAGLFSGYATPVEASALTALYAFVVEVVLYRDLGPGRQSVQVLVQCGLLVGGVLLILGVALGFTNYLVDAQVPSLAVEWATSSIHSPLLFLALLNVFLLIVGCLMDIFSAIVVVVPLIAPMGAAFGIDPVHLGIIFLANLELGYLTPPVGMNLFLASYRFHKPLPTIYRAVFPLLSVRLIGLLLITYLPILSTLLPRLFSR